jgi:hypothetical protein
VDSLTEDKPIPPLANLVNEVMKYTYRYKQDKLNKIKKTDVWSSEKKLLEDEVNKLDELMPNLSELLKELSKLEYYEAEKTKYENMESSNDVTNGIITKMIDQTSIIITNLKTLTEAVMTSTGDSGKLYYTFNLLDNEIYDKFTKVIYAVETLNELKKDSAQLLRRESHTSTAKGRTVKKKPSRFGKKYSPEDEVPEVEEALMSRWSQKTKPPPSDRVRGWFSSNSNKGHQPVLVAADGESSNVIKTKPQDEQGILPLNYTTHEIIKQQMGRTARRQPKTPPPKAMQLAAQKLVQQSARSRVPPISDLPYPIRQAANNEMKRRKEKENLRSSASSRSARSSRSSRSS